MAKREVGGVMSWTRALVFIAACSGFGIAASSRASAEGPTQLPPASPAPRAAQVARSFIAATYAPNFNTLIAQSIVAAADLTATADRAKAVVVERATVDADIAAIRAKAARPGAIADRLEREVVLIAQTPKVAALSTMVEVREAAVEAKDLATALQRQQASLGAEQDALTNVGVWSLPSADATWSMPLTGELTQPFGPTTFGWEPGRVVDGRGYAHFHDGIDIAAAYGSEIRAAAPGQVIFVGQIADGAQLVMIAHIGGYVSEYAHLMVGSPVRAGDAVAQGQVIGRVGMTGLTTGPHLHMQVWHGGVLIDPLTLIRELSPRAH